ncbi:MAG TPA: STN domain-containing protein, partial [Xanthobacteraceae bacterium]
MSATAQISDQVLHIKIPAQSLSSALTQFGRDTATEVEFEPQMARDKGSAAIDGEFSREAAIKQLLTGTGLTYRISPQGAIVIERGLASSPANAASRASTLSSAQDAALELDSVTVEARRRQETLKQQIADFIDAIAAPSPVEPLTSWQIPICPLVAGMPRDRAEFVLARVSQRAREANAPLAPKHCQPNLLIVVTSDPERLLSRWRTDHPNTFNDSSGLGGIKQFVASTLPIRVWYNVDDGCLHSLTFDIPANAGTLEAFPLASCSHIDRN